VDLIEGELSDPINHWYYSHKFAMIHKSIRGILPKAKRIIDVGAGSALFSKELIRLYPDLVSLAIDTGYTDKQVQASGPKIRFSTTYQDEVAQIYLFTDVLEHVSNPIDLLNTFIRGAVSGAQFVITVPAHSILWSGHDVFLKHHKRYIRSELNEVLYGAQLRVKSIRYIYTPLFPFALVHRLSNSAQTPRSQMREFSQPLNMLLKFILAPDHLLSRILPFGISLIAIAEKP
jgi:hypothetical protein